jgi:hypothetical protein
MIHFDPHDFSIDRYADRITARDRLIRKLIAACMLLLLLVMVLAIMLFAATRAQAAECQSRPGDKSYWSYRIIDGERCWYKGHRVIPKSSLHWPEEKPKPKKKFMDPMFHIRAEDKKIKVVKPDELNELDAQAREEPTPFVTLSDKLQGWAMWWATRVGEAFK